MRRVADGFQDIGGFHPALSSIELAGKSRCAS
jgi:hypothetical protein